MNHKRHALLVLALAAFGAAALAPEEAARSSRDEPVWSCQLHLHGSFSEGTGSIDSHSYEARDVGADVLWWSDHDFRITSHGMSSGFGFEDGEELPKGDPLAAQAANDRKLWIFENHGDRRAAGGWEIVDDHAAGEHAMRVYISSRNKDFEGRYVRLGSGNSRLTRPLAAQLSLRLAVKPIGSSVDAHGLVLITLSEHPDLESEPVGDELLFEELGLRYVVGGPEFEPWLEDGIYSVHVAAPDGEWSSIELPLTEDAERGFPSIVGRDNSMSRLGFGVEARGGLAFECLFDDLHIEAELPAASMFAVQAETIAEVARSYPSLRQLQGAEISYVSKHMNEFSVNTELLDYDALAAEVMAGDEATPERYRALVVERAIEGAHDRGGLISYNHMFGASWKGKSKKDSRNRALREVRKMVHQGIDLLEVGYPARGGQGISEHIWVWDQLASEGLPIVGTGVSDSHGGGDYRWRTAPNNFVTWIYAPTTDKADLIEGLRAGRAFFGDLTKFDGALDLLSDRGFAMGQIVITDRDEVEVSIRAEAAGQAQSLHVIVNARHVDTLFVAGTEYAHTLAIAPQAHAIMRVELHDRQDRPVVFTNALHFLREAPPAGIPAARAGLDFAGLVAVRFEGFDLLGAEREESGAVLLRGRANQGSFTLDTSSFEGHPAVELEDLDGTWEAIEGALVFNELQGLGAIRISVAQ